jgi:NMD protein affecting ribosome stability and mRNA decay
MPCDHTKNLEHLIGVRMGVGYDIRWCRDCGAIQTQQDPWVPPKAAKALETARRLLDRVLEGDYVLRNTAWVREAKDVLEEA